MLNYVILLERKVALAQENHSHPSCDKGFKTPLPWSRTGGNVCICTQYITAASELTQEYCSLRNTHLGLYKVIYFSPLRKEIFPSLRRI